jgi:hypothetical protein
VRQLEECTFHVLAGELGQDDRDVRPIAGIPDVRRVASDSSSDMGFSWRAATKASDVPCAVRSTAGVGTPRTVPISHSAASSCPPS